MPTKFAICKSCIRNLNLSPLSDGYTCEYCEFPNGHKFPTNYDVITVKQAYPGIEKHLQHYVIDSEAIDYLQRKKLTIDWREAKSSKQNKIIRT